ncbi:hypothetical protein SRB5_51630 [Streptomyces sp. RB5]|uniref:Uncharacterized protein n=1 Tax=Streptomyces smaragdinus TaxID=2585196 RepID=A0A7K0CNB9_9ACTN|nr:hypothetical protein [Streptomyces smaragdinus]MQY14986.1 hypothetical protein [Streptomyces smaragdinus]
MTFAVSAVLLFGVSSVIAVKTRSAGAGSAVVLFLFGFFTAGTGAYDPIRTLLATLAQTITQLR